ncbi:MAG TPA: glycosyltransferase family 4 protein, partial [Thermoanaerobaculia bacterium]|nr:glycosyltransferase family 4 protein [Thermoanaerobaculia bacterium]
NRWSSRVITVSEALRQTYLAKRDLAPEKVTVVHNGIELERFRRDRAATRARLEREFDIPPGRPILVTVSVLRPAKGIEFLLDAAKRVDNAVFLILGDGNKREEWQALAAQQGIGDRVRWAGYRTDVDTILAGCDALVHPSLDDAFPTVLLEAMAAGLPVVATRVGGIPEIVNDGATGILVPPGDAEALASGIEELLSDRERMRRMGALATDSAITRFSTAAWVSRLTAVYDEVLRRPRS